MKKVEESKVHPRTGHEVPESFSTLFLISALYGGWWSTPRPGRFYPVKETRYPLHGSLDVTQGYEKFRPHRDSPKRRPSSKWNSCSRYWVGLRRSVNDLYSSTQILSQFYSHHLLFITWDISNCWYVTNTSRFYPGIILPLSLPTV
jgi:hypothetical protein